MRNSFSMFFQGAEDEVARLREYLRTIDFAETAAASEEELEHFQHEVMMRNLQPEYRDVEFTFLDYAFKRIVVVPDGYLDTPEGDAELGIGELHTCDPQKPMAFWTECVKRFQMLETSFMEFWEEDGYSVTRTYLSKAGSLRWSEEITKKRMRPDYNPDAIGSVDNEGTLHICEGVEVIPNDFLIRLYRYDVRIMRKRPVIRADIPEGVIEVDEHAFFTGHHLTHVSFPSTLTRIGIQAFSSCEALQEITIPAGVVEIERLAFANCYSLKTLTILGSRTKLGEHVCEAKYGITLRAPAGSRAEQYAKDNGIPFEAL